MFFCPLSLAEMQQIRNLAYQQKPGVELKNQPFKKLRVGKGTALEASLVHADNAESGIGGGGHCCGQECHPAKGHLCEAAAPHTGQFSSLLCLNTLPFHSHLVDWQQQVSSIPCTRESRTLQVRH